jgi:hypothetical protein
MRELFGHYQTIGNLDTLYNTQNNPPGLSSTFEVVFGFFLELRLEVLFQVLTWLRRSYEVLMPRIISLVWCAIKKSHSIWSSPRALG